MPEVKYEYGVATTDEPKFIQSFYQGDKERAEKFVEQANNSNYVKSEGFRFILVKRRVVTDDWETVPEREDCPCASCVATVIESKPWPECIQMPFIVCETCGNKRCPHATHHDNECTGSNEPGQKGSRYGGLE